MGNPVGVDLTPGPWADSPQALPILSGLHPLAVVADKAYDTNAIIQTLTNQKI